LTRLGEAGISALVLTSFLSGIFMTITLLNGISEIADRYDLFICDVWGVVHDGLAPYEGFLDCLERLHGHGCRVALLSNAPRPVPVVMGELERIGVPNDAYDLLLTSGDAARGALLARADDWHAALGERYYHLGPERNAPTLEGVGRAAPLADADYIICTGLFDDETEQAEDYREMLSGAVDRGLPLLCTNPDIIVMRGEKLLPCAGAVAELYAGLGGEVRQYGKPYAEIYDELFARLSSAPEKPRCVMVGDAFKTDVKGAIAAGLDSIWVAGGVHAQEVAYHNGGPLNGELIETVAAAAGAMPTMAIGAMRW
jgi:HAD superfamily hydrolase (TIGR01459 family)